MEPIDQDTARLLAPLREREPRSESTVNVHRAVHAGVRRRRTRQVLAATAIAAVTALVVVVIPAVVSGRTLNQPAGPAGEFGPLRQEFTVGSAGGFTPVSYETGRYRQVVRLGPEHSDGPQGTATVLLNATGHVPAPEGLPAPDVNGRRALWLAGQDAGIAWEWADNAWATATVHGPVDEPQVRAHRVAQSVAPGAGVAVAVPFTVPRPAAGDPYQLDGAVIQKNPSDGARLVFGTPDGGRILVGVRRDPARGLVPVAEAEPADLLSPQRLSELAGSVRLIPNPTREPLR